MTGETITFTLSEEILPALAIVPEVLLFSAQEEIIIWSQELAAPILLPAPIVDTCILYAPLREVQTLDYVGLIVQPFTPPVLDLAQASAWRLYYRRFSPRSLVSFVVTHWPPAGNYAELLLLIDAPVGGLRIEWPPEYQAIGWVQDNIGVSTEYALRSWDGGASVAVEKVGSYAGVSTVYWNPPL